MSNPRSVYQRKPKRVPHSLGFSKYGILLDGVDDRGEVSKEMTGDRTWEAMIRPDFPYDDGNFHVIANWDLNSDNNLYFQKRDDGRLEIGGSAGATFFTARATEPFSAGHWHHIVGVRDEVNDVTRLFWDGEEIGTDSGIGTMAAGAGDLYIGCHKNLIRFFEGVHGYFREYNSALSVQEIQWNMLNYHRPTRDGLVLWLPLNEGQGLTAYDQSGAGNDVDLLPVADPPTWVRTKMWELRAEVV